MNLKKKEAKSGIRAFVCRTRTRTATTEDLCAMPESSCRIQAVCLNVHSRKRRSSAGAAVQTFLRAALHMIHEVPGSGLGAETNASRPLFQMSNLTWTQTFNNHPRRTHSEPRSSDRLGSASGWETAGFHLPPGARESERARSDTSHLFFSFSLCCSCSCEVRAAACRTYTQVGTWNVRTLGLEL